MKKRGWGLVLTTMMIVSGAVYAADESQPWNMGFGLTFPQGTGPTANVVKDGFGLDFNFGYHQPDRIIGFRVDMLYSSFKLSDSVLQKLDNAGEGYLTVFGGGPSLVLRPRKGRWIRPSLYAGPGMYYEHAEATWGEGCDPTFGCVNSGSNTETSKVNTTRWGYQGGVGLDFLFDDGGGAISLHVQYVRINNTHTDVEFVPINIGYKVMF